MKSNSSDSLARKVIRLGAFLLVSQMLATLFLVHHVRAEVHDLLRSVGSHMMALGEKGAQIKPRTIRLNGAELRLRVQTVKNEKLDHVLDILEARCRERNGRFYEQLKSTEKKTHFTEEYLSLFDAVMREEADGAGMVACLDMGEERVSPEAAIARVRTFLESGDASDVGHLRYARAEQDGDNVFVVMYWTDGPFNVKQMFPVEGDAPGIDFAGIKRPRESRRVLSAWEEGQAPALNTYVSDTLDKAALEAEMRRNLEASGYRLLTPPADKKQEALGTLAMRDGVSVLISAANDARGRGVVTIMPMDTAGETRGQSTR